MSDDDAEKRREQRVGRLLADRKMTRTALAADIAQLEQELAALRRDFYTLKRKAEENERAASRENFSALVRLKDFREYVGGMKHANPVIHKAAYVRGVSDVTGQILGYFDSRFQWEED